MLKITTDNKNPQLTTVHLCGRFTGEYVPEVEKELRTSIGRKQLALDLAEVTFVDRAAMTFLCAARSRKLAIKNAPLYVGLWMEQENCQTPSHSD
ncbi:MAG TPA: STAS domain-containing protein [Pyrinomonadaceae bacterium]|nr:STAS domain-containing protein [Pyrinomonadaceae bacterium]